MMLSWSLIPIRMDIDMADGPLGDGWPYAMRDSTGPSRSLCGERDGSDPLTLYSRPSDEGPLPLSLYGTPGPYSPWGHSPAPTLPPPPPSYSSILIYLAIWRGRVPGPLYQSL